MLGTGQVRMIGDNHRPVPVASPKNVIEMHPASDRMRPNIGLTRSTGESSHEIGDIWPAPLGRFAATNLRTRLGHPSSGVLRLIDTHCDSHSSRYVKSFVTGFRFSITPARSSCPKLRMPSATMNRVPASIWDKRHGLRQRPADGCRLPWLVEGPRRPLATVPPSRVHRCLMMVDCGGSRWIVLGCFSPCLRQRLLEVGLEFLER